MPPQTKMSGLAAQTSSADGVIVESDALEDGRAAQIVVERATYADHGAVRWAAGANALATRLPEP